MRKKSSVHMDDELFVWHPYTTSIDQNPLYEVIRTEGTKIYLSSGEILIDGMSSWWCAIHGYNHPKLIKAAEKQLRKFPHVMFGGFTHKPAVSLAKKLIKISPKGLQKVFFSDSGSVSVEVAMKFAIQYWHAKGVERKKRFLTARGGYHGDTFAAMSVSDPDNGMHNLFKSSLLKQYYTFEPESLENHKNYNSKSLKKLENILKDKNSEIAAIIIEPIVQGAGGMKFYHKDYLKILKKLCKKYNVLLILDEIATGFGRTGKLFACEHAKISPDIMCVGKSITGGTMSLAATIVSKNISNTISSKSPRVFMHGPTYMANPLACSVSLANIELLESYDWKKKVNNIEKKLFHELNKISENKNVKSYRVLGAIGVLEMYEDVNIGEIQKICVREGIWLRPFKNLIYLMPPYIISNADLDYLLGKLKVVIEEHYNN